jgi:hypothetical protein
MEAQKTPNSQSDFEQKGFTFLDFKLYYRAIVTKTACYRHKNRYIDQLNKIKISEVNSHKLSHLIFDKVAKTYTL